MEAGVECKGSSEGEGEGTAVVVDMPVLGVTTAVVMVARIKDLFTMLCVRIVMLLVSFATYFCAMTLRQNSKHTNRVNAMPVNAQSFLEDPWEPLYLPSEQKQQATLAQVQEQLPQQTQQLPSPPSKLFNRSFLEDPWETLQNISKQTTGLNPPPPPPPPPPRLEHQPRHILANNPPSDRQVGGKQWHDTPSNKNNRGGSGQPGNWPHGMQRGASQRNFPRVKLEYVRGFGSVVLLRLSYPWSDQLQTAIASSHPIMSLCCPHKHTFIHP